MKKKVHEVEHDFYRLVKRPYSLSSDDGLLREKEKISVELTIHYLIVTKITIQDSHPRPCNWNEHTFNPDLTQVHHQAP